MDCLFLTCLVGRSWCHCCVFGILANSSVTRESVSFFCVHQKTKFNLGCMARDPNCSTRRKNSKTNDTSMERSTSVAVLLLYSVLVRFPGLSEDTNRRIFKRPKHKFFVSITVDPHIIGTQTIWWSISCYSLHHLSISDSTAVPDRPLRLAAEQSD